MRLEASAPTVVWRQPQAVEADPAESALQRSEEPLLSLEAAEATALSFGALSAGLEARSAQLADSMVRDMLRPMLKQWLDDNLPPIVERMVRDGNTAGRARAKIDGAEGCPRVDFDRADAFITPVALAPAASVAHCSARMAVI